MGITYDGAMNRITITGYSEETPCDLTADLYAADQANGWGVIEKQGDYQYKFSCAIYVGDGVSPTWVRGLDAQVEFQDIDFTGKNFMYVSDNAILQLGLIINETLKTTYRGGLISVLDNSYSKYYLLYVGSAGTAKLYGSIFRKPGGNPYSGYPWYVGPFLSDTCKIWNCIFDSIQGYSINGDHYNTTMNKSVRIYGQMDTEAEGIKLFHSKFEVSVGNYRLSRPYVRNPGSRLFSASNIAQGSDIYVLDADTDTWNIGWAGTNLAPIYRKYTFNLVVLDEEGEAIEGANVLLKDADGNQVFADTTDSDGKISEQRVDRGYCEDPDDYLDTELTKDYSPHTLTITAASKRAYVCDFILDEAINWRVTLEGWEALEQPLTIDISEDDTTVDIIEDAIIADVAEDEMVADVTVDGAVADVGEDAITPDIED